MDFSLWISTGRPWGEMRAAARALVDAGGCGGWVPDHFMPPPAGYRGRAGAAPARPPGRKPRGVVPLLMGGGGERRTLRTAARHGDEWNAWGLPETLKHKGAILDAHCAEAGRDSALIRRSAALFLRIAPDAAAAAALGARFGGRGGLGGT